MPFSPVLSFPFFVVEMSFKMTPITKYVLEYSNRGFKLAKIEKIQTCFNNLVFKVLVSDISRQKILGLYIILSFDKL